VRANGQQVFEQMRRLEPAVRQVTGFAWFSANTPRYTDTPSRL
jgi:hypothetical protein